MIDIDEWRDQQISLHGLSGTDVEATFYYDETNNIRKLYIGAQGLNVAELKVFVLGGILHKGKPRPIDLNPLREAMWIQRSAPEIKLQHVATGSFLEALNSKKLTVFLRWLMANDLLVHYHELDPFYWSIVDIIDSLIPGIGDSRLMLLHVWLKSDLAKVLRVDQAATIKLFRRHGYPGLIPESRKPFLLNLIELFDAQSNVIPDPSAGLIRYMLRAGLDLEELPFIEDNTPHRLIEDFSLFYLTRIAVFNEATHVLDMEESIRDRLEKMSITRGGIPASHFRFADSKMEPGIQISDVIVGLLGKMHTYLTQSSPKDVSQARGALIGPAEENANLLRDCIARSDSENPALLNHVANQHDLKKIDIFLRFLDGQFAS